MLYSGKLISALLGDRLCSTTSIPPALPQLSWSLVQTRCTHPTATECFANSNQCVYSFRYGDGRGTSGFYVSDGLHFDLILGASYAVNSSASVTFGCSTEQSGELMKTEKVIDGIFGFGRGPLSAVSQLSSRDIIPKVFSHCLKGDGSGGELLVLGEILEPNIVYTPLLPSKTHYNLNLQSISVSEKVLPIGLSVFVTSNSQGTIVDSGTTQAYLLGNAYDHFVAAIDDAVYPHVTLSNSTGSHCYLVTSSLSGIFPLASLNFVDDASMKLKPNEYLICTGLVGGTAQWCIGFERIQQGIIGNWPRVDSSSFNLTLILVHGADLVLKGKIVVYDLAEQRIGWAEYDCSRSVNVSLAYGQDESVESAQPPSSSTGHWVFLLPLVLTSLVIILNVL